ncbi:unnamed protein product [Brassica oleracea]
MRFYPNFLRFYMGSYNENASFPCILGDLTYLPRLSMLDWAFYPGKRLPSTFQPECLVTLRMTQSNLEKLWGGILPLANLKEMDLSFSFKLKEMPNLTNATNLETLTLTGTSLVELPSSIKNSHKLKELEMRYCTKLRVIPANNINLASLEKVDMNGCSRLRTFPNISSNIEYLDVGNTKIEDVPASVAERWSRLKYLIIGNKSLKRLTHVPINVIYLDLSNSDIKKIPDCVIGLRHLHDLIIRNCRKLVSLQSLPLFVWHQDATDCVSLRFLLSASGAVFYLFRNSMFRNCLKLDEEARRLIIQRWDYRCLLLPGREIPAEFTHKATGKSITIPEGAFSTSSSFKACVLLSSALGVRYLDSSLYCRLRSKGVHINEIRLSVETTPAFLSEHLLVLCGDLFQKERYHNWTCLGVILYLNSAAETTMKRLLSVVCIS